MTSYVKSCYSIAVHSVKDAISKDGRAEIKEAYCDYLSCMVFMVNALKDEAWETEDLKELCHEETFKVFQLTERCLGRTHDILKSLEKESDEESMKNNDDVKNEGPKKTPVRPPRPTSSERYSRDGPQRRHSQPPIPTVYSPPVFRKATRTVSSIAPVSLSNPQNYSQMILSLPSPPGFSSTSTSPTSFQSQNNDMFQAYQRRKTLRGNAQQRYAAVNFNLSMFRKEAEKMALTKARQKAVYQQLVERQKQTKLEAERRWNQRANRSSRDKDYRQSLLVTILAFEDNVQWPKSIRTALEKNSDISSIMYAVQTILGSRDHPLSQVLLELRMNAYEHIKKLLENTPATKDDNEYLHAVDSLDYRKKNALNMLAEHELNEGLSPNINPRRLSAVSQESLKLEHTDSSTKDVSENTIEEPQVNVKDVFVSTRTISLETAFNDMQDEMFSSDSDIDETDTEKLDNTSLKKETDGYEVFEQGDVSNNHTPLAAKFSNITIKVSDVESDPTYHELAPGWDTLKKNREFFKSIEKSHNEISETTNSNDKSNPSNDSIKKTGKPSDNTGNVQESEETPPEIDLTNKITSIRRLDSEDFTPLKKDLELDGNNEYMELKSDAVIIISKTAENALYDTNATDDCYCDMSNDDILEGEYEVLGTPTKPDRKSVESIYQEIDDLKEVVSELTDKPSINGSKLSPDVHSAECINKKVYRRFSQECLALIDTEYLKGLDNIIQDVLFGIDRIHSVLLLTYEQLDTPTGRDQTYATLEEIFFKNLWPWVIKMFRQLNVYKEEAMLLVMQKYSKCGPADMKIRDKYTLTDPDDSSPQHPYQPSIEELKKIQICENPLEKLECVVRMTKAACHCVEAYWSGKGEGDLPVVGGDDLLPIVSYIVLKTRLPQIVSECHAMEEFIHEGYLMGEEGYCLSTLHAAISYLLSLSKET